MTEELRNLKVDYAMAQLELSIYRNLRLALTEGLTKEQKEYFNSLIKDCTDRIKALAKKIEKVLNK